jgi:DNA replication and repair protein RecF
MALTHLQITHVRNLQRVALQGLRGVNAFYGPNGSGKTSILEAIHLLGMARSFRGGSVKSLITHGKESCTVFGMTTRGSAGGVGEAPRSSGLGLSLGVQRYRTGEAQIKVGGKATKTLATLAEQLPLQVITAASFDLLTGAPGSRRRYLDWGVFHVEHQFFEQWKRFQRCLKQRNNLLRRGKVSDQELLAWTRDLAEAGTAINRYRKAYFQMLVPRFREVMERLAPSLETMELRYQQGWDKKQAYGESLQQGLSADLDQGYTHSGPQRADIKVFAGGHPAAETLSRGQQKLVVCGLKLAQGQLMSQQGGGRSTYLIDDLPSELDRDHCSLVCDLLASMEAQVFITSIEQQEIQSVWPAGQELAVFHVEQGSVRPGADT